MPIPRPCTEPSTACHRTLYDRPMSGYASVSREVVFGPWRVRPTLREVEGPRGTIRVKPKSMEVFLALLKRPREVLSREELLAEVWKDTYVGDEVLTQSVAQLRRAFGDDPTLPQVIETVPRVGYRLLLVPRRGQSRDAIQPRTGRRGSPLVGREYERCAFLRALDDAETAKGGVIFLTGEPGIGKTRLAEESSTLARDRSFVVLAGRCSDDPMAVPLQPFVEILEQALAVFPRDTFRSLPPDFASVIARIAPAMRREFRRIPPPLKLPPEQQRRHLFNGYLDLLERGCEARPLYLVLDDLQWADEATCLLLRHLGLAAGRLRLLIAGTFRDTEVGETHALRRVQAELIRQRLAKCFALGPLSSGELAQVLEWSAGSHPPESAVDFFVRSTDGNPFFLEELYQHLVERHGAADATDWWRGLLLPEVDVPAGVRAVILERVRRLGDDTRRFLTVAAVVGRTFDPRLVRAVAGQTTRERFLSSVDEAESAGMVVPKETARGLRYELTHDLIRHSLLAEISLVRQQHMHLDIGRCMEALYPEPNAYATEIVSHLEKAGAEVDPAMTIRYSILAAEAALEAAASEDALHHVERAMSLVQATDRQTRARLLFLRGYSLRGLLRWQETLGTWREAIPLFEALGDAELMTSTCRDMAILSVWRQEWDEAIHIAERGLALVGEAPTRERGYLLCQASLGHSGARRFEEGQRLVAEAEGIARHLKDSELLGTVLFYRAVPVHYQMRVRDQLRLARRCVDMLRGTNNLWDLVPALEGIHMALYGLGQLEEMAACEAEIERIAERVGHIGSTLLLHQTRAHRQLLESGDLVAFADGAASRLETADRIGLPLFQTQSRLDLGQVACWRGDLSAADAQCREAGRFERFGPESGSTAAVHLRIRAELDRTQALDLLAAHENLLPSPGRPAAIGSWKLLLSAVESLAMLGQVDRVASMHHLVVDAMTTTGALVPLWSTTLFSRIAGISAAAARQWEEATAHFERAWEECHGIPNLIERPFVLWWWAWMLLRRGETSDDARAGELLAEAHAGFREAGIRPPAE